MSNESPEDLQPSAGDPQEVEGAAPPVQEEAGLLSRWFETLAQVGLGETVVRLGTHALFLALVVMVAWLMHNFYEQIKPSPANGGALAAGPTATPVVVVGALPAQGLASYGIARQASIHTNIPTRPRQEVIKYTVVQGDTVIGIADKYGLKPQSILWANYNTLLDIPENLSAGQSLNILPLDGTYYQWQPGDGLNGVAKYFGVKPEEIINFPANNIDPGAVGDPSNPNIKAGTWLIVPGGTREFTNWSAPVGVTRSNPAAAREMGPGSCSEITDGAVGIGGFIWPSAKHYLSGYDYSVATNHRGIDIAGNTGEAVWAADAGVIVYAGWNDWGYGNMVMVDHGNGWQSLYAHLSAINVVCGQSVGQGTVIGAIGSTGHSSGAHLHFELMHSIYSKVNPWDYLPAP